MIKVMTVGVFDILHIGHIKLLKKSKKLGDYLIVGIQDDISVFKQKGKYPIMNTKERIEIIKVLDIADEIFIYSNLDQTENLKKYKPNIFTQGPDYLKGGNRINMLEYMKNNNIEFKIIKRTEGISSTEIKKRIIGK